MAESGTDGQDPEGEPTPADPSRPPCKSRIRVDIKKSKWTSKVDIPAQVSMSTFWFAVETNVTLCSKMALFPRLP